MQLGSLKVFCDVARHRSFSLAAQSNDITQSAASQIVSQLEKRMNVQLIDRSTRPLQLTPLGQTFFDGCKRLLEQYTELESKIRNAQQQLAGTVQVAAIYSVGLTDMGNIVKQFAQEQPDAEVHIEYIHPDQVYEKVTDGTADLGLVSFPRKSPKLVSQPWRDEEMLVVCPPKHELARHVAIEPNLLTDQKFVHFDRGLLIRRKIDRLFRQNQVVVDVVLEFDSIENIKQAVAIGAGIALLPEPTVRSEIRSRHLVARPLYGCGLTRSLGIIQRRRQTLNSAAQRFLELLLSVDNQQEDDRQVGSFAAGTGHHAHPHHSQRSRNGKPRASKRA